MGKLKHKDFSCEKMRFLVFLFKQILSFCFVWKFETQK